MNVLNSNGFSILLPIVILLLIIFYYAAQLKRQTSEVHKLVLYSQRLHEAEIESRTNAKHNFIYLLNAELRANTMYMIGILEFLQSSNLPIKSIKNFEEDTNIQSTTWSLIYVEASKLFSKEMMQELINYYSEISNRKFVNSESTKLHIPFIMQQLNSYTSCIKLMEAELGQELSKQTAYEKAVEVLSKYEEN